MVVKNIPCCLVLADKRIILIPSFSLFDFLCVIWVRCRIPPVLVIGPRSIPARIFCRCILQVQQGEPSLSAALLLVYSFQQTPIALGISGLGKKGSDKHGGQARQNPRLALSLTWPLYHFPFQDTQVCPVLTAKNRAGRRGQTVRLAP